MITTTISGNPNVFLVFIGGVIAFLGGLALMLAIAANLASSVKRGIAYFYWLTLWMGFAGCMWHNLKYGGPLPFGLFFSWLGILVAMLGALIIHLGLFAKIKKVAK